MIIKFIRYSRRFLLLVMVLLSVDALAIQERGVMLGVGMSNFTGSPNQAESRSMPSISLSAL